MNHIQSSNEEGLYSADVSRKLSGVGKWSSRATQLFLQMMLQEADKLHSPYIKQRDIWRHISQELTKEGFRLVAEHVERKWHNLLRTYRIHKRQRTANGFKFWEYYEMMDKIMGSLPNDKTSLGPTVDILTTNSQFPITSSVSTAATSLVSTTLTQLPTQNLNLPNTSSLIIVPVSSSSVPPPNAPVYSMPTPVTSHSHFLSPLLPKTSQENTSAITLSQVLPNSQPYCPPAFTSPTVCFSEQPDGHSAALPLSPLHPVHQPDSSLGSSPTLCIKQELDESSSVTPECRLNSSFLSVPQLGHPECKPNSPSVDTLPPPLPSCQLDSSSGTSFPSVHSKRRKISTSAAIESGNEMSTFKDETKESIESQGSVEKNENMRNESSDAHTSALLKEQSKVLKLIYQGLQANNRSLEQFNNGLQIMHADINRLSSAVESLTQTLNKR
ncbi:ESCRT-I complex subunit tsg101-like isoform X2 [Homarus americanus]|nr:ESCRT-I complex subunit tsg101-like isoform X2 [Homarus americanus]